MEGTELLVSKQFQDAIAIFAETIDAFPADSHLYFKRAQALRHMKLYPAAVKDLFECINLSGGSNEEAEHALADSLSEMGLDLMEEAQNKESDTEKKLRDAISYFSEGFKWHDHYKYLLRRGECFALLNEHENALRDYSKAKLLSGGAPEVLQKIASLHNEWGKILFKKKKFGMADQELSRSLDIFKENPTVYLNRAKVRFRMNRHGEAVEDIVASFLLNSQNPEAAKLVEMYVPAVIGDKSYQEKFRQKLFRRNLNQEPDVEKTNHQTQPSQTAPSKKKIGVSMPVGTSIPPIDPRRRSNSQTSSSRPSTAPMSRKNSASSTPRPLSSRRGGYVANTEDIRRTKKSDRDRFSLSRQLQYANRKVLRPYSASASTKKKSRTNAKRLKSGVAASRQSFSSYAHQRFRDRKQKKEEGIKSPGVKRSARLTELSDGKNGVIIDFLGRNMPEGAGNVHMYT